MKDKMKNTLEHEVELLGRSVSVLLIAGLLVVGGASAALLNSFAQVDGDVDVTQAIEVNGEEGTYELTGQTVELTAGESFSASTFIENNADQEITLDLWDDEDLGSTEGVTTEAYAATTLTDSSGAGEEVDVSVNTVEVDDGYETGFHVTGESNSDSDDRTDETAMYGGVFYESESDVVDDVEDLEDNFEAEIEFETLAGHSFQEPDWVSVNFEAEGETYTWIDVTNDDSTADFGGSTFLLDSEGEVISDSSTPSGELDDEDDVTVNGVGLQSGSAGNLEDSDEINILYQTVDIGTDGTDEETLGEPIEFDGDVEQVTIPSTAEDEVGFELGLAVETDLYLDGSQNYEFEFILGNEDGYSN